METFADLTARLEEELHRLRYRESTIGWYRRIWTRLATFLDRESSSSFTEVRNPLMAIT